MPFLEPETAMGEAIFAASKDGSSTAKFTRYCACGATLRLFNDFQEVSTTYEKMAPVELRSTDSRGRLSPHKPPWPVRQEGCLHKGVTPFIPSSYNDLVMSTVRDAAQQIQFAQFASARVLAALLSVSAALPGESAVAIAA